MEHLRGQDLRRILTPAHPLIGLIHQVREGGYSLTEYGISLDSPRFAVAGATVHAGPVADAATGGGGGGSALLTIHQPSIAPKIDQQLIHRNAARSVPRLAALLPHGAQKPLVLLPRPPPIVA